MNLQTIFERYAAVVVFDTETSGLDFDRDQIIELAAMRIEPGDHGLKVTATMDTFIRLPKGQKLSPKITELTGITDELLAGQGVKSEKAAAQFADMLKDGPTLMAAHNAQFDLLFTNRLLKGQKIGPVDFLDTLTVYKDRAAYPHKLEAAIRHYKLESKVQNSHRAIDDVCALLEVAKAMDAERDDLHAYINVFGYNPKYGISGEKIAGITYHEQGFTNFKRPERLTLPALAK